MNKKEKVILIVEDKEDYSEYLRSFVEELLCDLRKKEEIVDNYVINQVYNYEQAIEALKSNNVVVSSIDIALDDDETSKLMQRSKSPKGISVLEKIQAMNFSSRPITFVVSGEDPQYGIAALQNLGIMNYQRKSLFDHDVFIKSVQVGILLMQVKEIKYLIWYEGNDLTFQLMQEKYLHAKHISHLAGIDERLLPGELRDIDPEFQDKYLDIETGLPGSEWCKKRLLHDAIGNRQFLILHLITQNYYDAIREQDMILSGIPKQIADFMKRLRTELNDESLFIGRVKLTAELDFIMIMDAEKFRHENQKEIIRIWFEEIRGEFSKRLQLHFSSDIQGNLQNFPQVHLLYGFYSGFENIYTWDVLRHELFDKNWSSQDE
jgi:CheY-like chemotaxis protein